MADRWNLEAKFFALNDAADEKEWGSIHVEVGTVVCTLTTALSSLRNVVTPAGQVRYVRTSDLHFSFLCL